MNDTQWAAIVATAVVLGACGNEFSSADHPDASTTTTTTSTGSGATGGTAGAGGSGASAGTGAGGEAITCPQGQGDCNHDAVDGCETDVTMSTRHCGACDHDCLGGDCVGSACQPVKLADAQGAGTGLHNGRLALSPTHVYVSYVDSTFLSGGVAVVAKDGTGLTCVACDTGAPGEVATDDAFVYWTDPGAHAIGKAAFDGGGPSLVYSTPVAVPIAVGPTALYYFNSVSSDVRRVDLDGANATAIAPMQFGVTSFAFDNGWLFWTKENGEVVAKDLANTSNPPTVMATGRTLPRSLAVDDAYVYWAEGNWGVADNAIMRMARGAGTMDPLASESVHAIAIDETNVYAADGSGGTIWWVPKTGGEPTFLATAQPSYPMDIAVDPHAVYWSTEDPAEVYKVAK